MNDSSLYFLNEIKKNILSSLSNPFAGEKNTAKY